MPRHSSKLLARFSVILPSRTERFCIDRQRADVAARDSTLDEARANAASAGEDDATSRRSPDAQGRFMRGLILTELGRSGDAIAVFTKLTEDFPELPEPYNNLAILYAAEAVRQGQATLEI